MALTVGTDSYISLADANTYLSTYYLSTDAKKVAWDAMTDSDNEVLLRQALAVIERQPYIGYKVLETQNLQFPRIIYSKIPNYLETRRITRFFGQPARTIHDHWYTQPSVPLEVLHAQCEIAFNLVEGPDERAELQRQGVKSFSVLGLSETYSGAYNRLFSDRAKELLAPYMGGGFAIC